MKIKICCPSYKRPKVESFDYLGDLLNVYVCESEYKNYIEANPEYKKNIIKVPLGVQGNVCRIRNYIIDDVLNTNDVCVIVDDDLKGIYYHEKMNRNLVEKKNFLTFVKKYSIMANDIGAKLWGVNLNPDPQCYREYTPFSTTSPVLGPFQCFLKGNNCYYDEALPLKEDYDMSLQQLNENRIILRINKFHYDCKQSTQAGGCATYRNIKKEKEQFDLLRQKWGNGIVKEDKQDRSHSSNKVKKRIDYNPVLSIPIKGV